MKGCDVSSIRAKVRHRPSLATRSPNSDEVARCWHFSFEGWNLTKFDRVLSMSAPNKACLSTKMRSNGAPCCGKARWRALAGSG